MKNNQTGRLGAISAIGLIALLAVSATGLSGCATPANLKAMTVQVDDRMPPLNPTLKGAIEVREVSGGKDTNPLWTSQVDDAAFKGALNDSLTNAGYLSAPGGKGKYAVTAVLQGLDQPLFGLTMDVKSNVLYKIEGAGKSKSVPVSAVGSATVSDAFYGPARLQLANERSILENIREFLRQLKDL